MSHPVSVAGAAQQPPTTATVATAAVAAAAAAPRIDAAPEAAAAADGGAADGSGSGSGSDSGSDASTPGAPRAGRSAPQAAPEQTAPGQTARGQAAPGLAVPAQAAPGYVAPPCVYDLDGGRACLDFANTRSVSSGDQLTTYARLVAFAEQSALITPEHAAWLQTAGQAEPELGQRALNRARRLRDAMQAVFAALAAGQTPRDHDLGVINHELGLSLSHQRVLPDGQGGYRWSFVGRGFESPLWPITRSAADLLTSAQDLRLIRECGAEDCAWLFLDTTRNRSRQWCSMASCGNREKARRHYQRKQRAARRLGD
jgi:predicted RNA-binding Zn ribbon-like protein